MKNRLKLVRNDDLLNKLQGNLTKLGFGTGNGEKDILNKAEEIIKSKAESSEAKGSPNKRMFSMPNIEDRLIFFENKFNQAENSNESNRLKR